MAFNSEQTRFEPAGASRGLALLLPGRAYSPDAPLLWFARMAAAQHGFTVQQVWWDTTDHSASTDFEAFVRREVEQALADEDADHVVLIGKSLGTRAAGYAAERGLDAIWLTPLLVEPTVAEAIAANPGRQLLIGGFADELWHPGVAAELREAGCEVLEVPDADHAMCAPGDVVRSARIQAEVAEAIHFWLSQI